MKKNKSKGNAKYIAGLLVLMLALSLGTAYAQKKSAKKKSAAKKSTITQLLCTKYRQWELSGTLTKNDRKNHGSVVEACRKRFRNLMFSDLKSAGDDTGTSVRFSETGKKPNSKACRTYRKWELQKKLTQNSADYGFVIEYCRKKLPTVMRNSK